MEIKCFYHSADLDGHCSGAIVKRYYPECRLIGINYGEKFPFDYINKDDKIIMVDFSLQPFLDMVTLYDIVGRSNFIWIDHHNLRKEYDKYFLKHYKSVLGVRNFESEFAACELTWNYYFRENDMPRAVKLLSLYDIWKHNEDEDILPFQMGMRARDTNPNNYKLWSRVFHNLIQDVIDDGKPIIDYTTIENERYIKESSFMITFEGLNFIATNRLLTNSKIFDSIWNESYFDGMMTFGFVKDHWRVSLYSTKENVDVSVIAKMYGGGGHKSAAGFQCKNLVIDLSEAVPYYNILAQDIRRR